MYSDILLIRSPFYAPVTPPLGLGILKAYSQARGIKTNVLDVNTDWNIWNIHHEYFNNVLEANNIHTRYGYSKLWLIIDAHMLLFFFEKDVQKRFSGLKELFEKYYFEIFTIKLFYVLENQLADIFKRLEEFVETIDLSNYKVIGTSTFSGSLGPSLQILKLIKQKDSKITTVIGGGIFAEDLHEKTGNLDILLKECEFVDHLVIGEGEEQLLNIYFGKNKGEKIISNRLSNHKYLDINEIPTPDFSDLDLNRNLLLCIEGSRSCPFQCNFCSETLQWGQYRKKDVNRLYFQINELVDVYKKNGIFLSDSLINPYIDDFSKVIDEGKLRVFFDGYLRADKHVLNCDVERWARAGLSRVRLGIESGSQKVLDHMNKKTTVATIKQVLIKLANEGIKTTTYWITGFPYETENDFNETKSMLNELKDYIYEAEIHPYYYYPFGNINDSVNLYSPELENSIKIKQWESEQSLQSREIRYNRCDELGKFVTSIGLTNIHSLHDKMKADQRWQKLHANAPNLII